jgi:hypothetical protein
MRSNNKRPTSTALTGLGAREKQAAIGLKGDTERAVGEIPSRFGQDQPQTF